MYIIFFLVSFLASVAGAICGIGGGVIIKPLLDAVGIMSVSAISFLSGCTVLSMSMVSVGSAMQRKSIRIKFEVTLPLAIGAAIGGLVGKAIFQSIKNAFGAENTVGIIQAAMLLVITAITFYYTWKKEKTRKSENNIGLSKKQKDCLEAELKRTGVEIKAVQERYHIENPKQMPSEIYDKVMAALAKTKSLGAT